MPVKVLDAWALMGWLQNEEPVSSLVDHMLDQSTTGEIDLVVSWINLGEVYYLLSKRGSSGFLVGGQRVAGSSILPTRRRPQSHRSPKGGQEIPKYPTRQSGRGQLVKGIRH